MTRYPAGRTEGADRVGVEERDALGGQFLREEDAWDRTVAVRVRGRCLLLNDREINDIRPLAAGSGRGSYSCYLGDRRRSYG